MEIENSRLLLPKLRSHPLHFQTDLKPSATSSPPLHTAISIPFLWEEYPGKPRSTCTTSPPSSNLQLQLPPRLLLTAITDVSCTNTVENKFMKASSVCGSFSYPGENSPEKERALAGLELHESGRFLKGWGRRPVRGKGRIMDMGERGSNQNGCGLLPPFSPALRGDGKVIKSASRSMSSSSLFHAMATIRASIEQVVPWMAKKNRG